MSVTSFQLDEQRILTALMEVPVENELAREEGARLFEGWYPRFIDADLGVKIIAAELGFMIWLDKDVLAIGVMDRIAQDEEGVFGGEWKSHKAPRLKMNGEPYQGQGEEDWLKEISNGPQLALYALALHKGKFYSESGAVYEFLVDNPRIKVRAAVKTNPPTYWPQDDNGMFMFPNALLKSVEAAFINKAAAIRASRATGATPWQLPGKHCFDWGRFCQFHEECLNRQYRQNKNAECGGKFNPNDPAAKAALSQLTPEQLANPNLVVLSASGYSDYTRCMELGRIMYGGLGPKESSLALDTGSCLHACLGDYHSQLIEFQQNNAQDVLTK